VAGLNGCGEEKIFCEMSVFRRGVVEAFALLGCYAAYVGSYLPEFRNSVSMPTSRVKQCQKISSGTAWSLKM
jgi:hypothetical protein